MPAVLAFFSNPKYPTEFYMPRRGCCSAGKPMAQIQSGARTPCVFLKHHRGLSSALSDIFPVILKLCFSCAYLVMIRKKLASLRMTSLFLKCFILCILMFACMYICATTCVPRVWRSEENVRFPEAEFKMVLCALNQPQVLWKINMCL